jgi:hypothetical protein
MEPAREIGRRVATDEGLLAEDVVQEGWPPSETISNHLDPPSS